MTAFILARQMRALLGQLIRCAKGSSRGSSTNIPIGCIPIPAAWQFVQQVRLSCCRHQRDNRPRIERAVQPDGAQRSALQELQDAMSEAANLLSSECPTYRALTPVGRLQAMEQRLDAMLHAVQTVQPALEKFYASLNDEQKERFNRLSPAQG